MHGMSTVAPTTRWSVAGWSAVPQFRIWALAASRGTGAVKAPSVAAARITPLFDGLGPQRQPLRPSGSQPHSQDPLEPMSRERMPLTCECGQRGGYLVDGCADVGGGGAGVAAAA